MLTKLRWSVPLVIPAVAALTTSAQAPLSPAEPRPEAVFLAQREPAQISTLFATGAAVETQWHRVWRPVCGDGSHVLDRDGLARIAANHADLVATTSPIVVDAPHAEGGGINIVFNVTGSVPAGALAALGVAEAYMEGVFSDPITITVDLSFANLGAGVLGGTGSSYTNLTWASTRSALVTGMDANDTLQSSLPAGTTIPVRYTNNTTNETRCFWTKANFKATAGTATGSDASMQYNNAFSWDFDPSNGINAGTYSFVDVVIHETGHAMGFTSGVDFRFNDIEVLDVYRFQRTDGNQDYNPDTTAEFGVRPRMARFNQPNDDHNSDLVSAEYRMSDGSPYQASHFREQTTNIGIMDPAFAPGETWYPAYYSNADVAMFDAIGYDN